MRLLLAVVVALAMVGCGKDKSDDKSDDKKADKPTMKVNDNMAKPGDSKPGDSKPGDSKPPPLRLASPEIPPKPMACRSPPMALG